MRVLITGVAGFVGFHLARDLLGRGAEILGIDSLNDYYDPQLKADRIAAIGEAKGFTFKRCDIIDAAKLDEAAKGFRPDLIVHLAAQAGVRYSLQNPTAYVESNVRGQLNMLELARRSDGLQAFIYASSSSVYGDRKETPFRESDRCDNPVSVYAATKRSGELLAEAHAKLYGLSLTGLRFFTVYGPWGRPDMAYWLFTEAVLKGQPIKLFNRGEMRRDFTDVRDIVGGMTRIIDGKPKAGHEIYNIGHSEPVTLKRFLTAIETATGKAAKIEMAPMQPGDVGDTYADVSKLKAAYGYEPAISVEDGIGRFVEWFRGYRKI